jgi:WS/DGAT/MGAT family acyltransferase
MKFERFKRYIESRLPISPIFRRKLATQVFDLDRPAWVEDEHFNIDQHVFEQLPKTNNIQLQKSELVNHFFSTTLNQSRPLWEMLFFNGEDCTDEGTSNGEFYVLLKFHHAAVDGMSAEKILSGLLSPERNSLTELSDSWEPKPTPLSKTVSEITGKHLQNAYRSPNKLLGLAKRLSHSVLSSQALRFVDKQQLPPHFFMAPDTPFNQAIGKEHDFSSAHLSLKKIKEVRRAYPGSTINDVILAICSGALRTHLNEQGQLPEQALVAMIPVSKRAKDQTTEKATRENGNSISPMLVSLATNLESPESRLSMIHQNTLVAKKFNHKVAVEKIMKHLPSWSSSLTIKAYTNLRLAKFLKPVFNMIITNVPGPTVPLYLDGAEMKSMEGIAPIVDGMGLTMVVTSYIDTLTISLTSCASMSKHAHQLTQNFDKALCELHQQLVIDNQVQPLKAA